MVSADISVIGRYIGFTDNRKAYRYRLSVSADKEAHIGSHTDMKITPLFSLNFMILAKETCEKFHFFLVTRAFSIFSCVSFEINFPEWLWCTKLNSYSIFKKTTNNYSYIGIGISIGWYKNFDIGILSVSADMKIFISAFYRYWPIRKRELSALYRYQPTWKKAYWSTAASNYVTMT